MYRSSAGNLGYYDEPPRRSDRWDRERFERYNRGGPDDRESFRFEESSHPRGGRGYRDVEVDERIDRRGSRGRVEERDRYYEEDRYSRRRPEFLNEPTPSEVANRALAPYRRKSVVEHEIDVSSRRPARPMYIRRQSSLDTFDRRPLPRYSEYEHEEWRPPTNVPIPLPIRERRRSPSRSRRYEEDFEEIRYKDVEPSYREEDYRDVRIRREKSTTRRSKSHRGARSDRSSTSSFEEISPVREVGKRGRTRMPRRLVHKQAVIDLGYPFEEEEDFIVVKRALEKEQIDEVIKISENYKDKKVTYHYEEKVEEMAPAVIAEPLAPPPPLELIPLPPPPPSEHHSHHHHQHHHAHSVRSASPPRTLFEERIDESATIAGPLAALVPGPRSEREITAEILALEAERRRIKTERESEYEFIEAREPRKEIEARREVIRVEKDRKARRRDDSKILGAMVSTLT